MNTPVSTHSFDPDMTPQQRITRLATLKAINTTTGQIDYLDVLFTELAQYCATLDRVYALADLVDTAIEEICWARLRNATTGPHRTQQPTQAPGPHPAQTNPADSRTA